jgi:hypothetical protein
VSWTRDVFRTVAVQVGAIGLALALPLSAVAAAPTPGPSALAQLVAGTSEPIAIVNATWCPAGCDGVTPPTADSLLDVRVNGKTYTVLVTSATTVTVNGSAAHVSQNMDSMVAYITPFPVSGRGPATTIALFANSVTGIVQGTTVSQQAPNAGSFNPGRVDAFTLLSWNHASNWRVDANFSGTLPVGHLVTVRLDASGEARIARPSAVPAWPTKVTATAGPGTATVRWQPPAYAGAHAITGYVVTGSPGGSAQVGPGATVAVVQGLTPGTRYTFIVRALNGVRAAATWYSAPAKPADGEGDPSLPSNAVVPEGTVVPPGGPSGQSAGPPPPARPSSASSALPAAPASASPGGGAGRPPSQETSGQNAGGQGVSSSGGQSLVAACTKGALHAVAADVWDVVRDPLHALGAPIGGCYAATVGAAFTGWGRHVGGSVGGYLASLLAGAASGAVSGGVVGALGGSFVPGAGTAVGAGLGAAIGSINGIVAAALRPVTTRVRQDLPGPLGNALAGAFQGAVTGAATGAVIGSVVPVVGTVVGAAAGMAIGTLAGVVGGLLSGSL